jgi:hypothetical protein
MRAGLQSRWDRRLLIRHLCQGHVISDTVTCPQMKRFVKFCPGTVQKGLGRDRTTPFNQKPDRRE